MEAEFLLLIRYRAAGTVKRSFWGDLILVHAGSIRETFTHRSIKDV